MLETMWQDIRYAGRSLGRTPGFTAAAIVTLALGIGANTAVFSVVEGVLLHPVPFAEPDRIMAVYGRTEREQKNSISYPNFLDWQRDARTFTALAIWRPDFFVLTGRGPAEQLLGKMVSADFFSVLRVQPVLGRVFRPDEDRLGGDAVAMLGEGLWRRRFAADPRIVGQMLTLNGRSYTVIGIVPSSVRLMRVDESFINDVFLPVGQYHDPVFRQRGVNVGSFGLGRLADGVTVARARAEMDAIASGLEKAYPQANGGEGINIVPLEQDVAGDIRPTLVALFAAVGFVLLIACANVANLLLARSTNRSREFAVKLALGGSRGRLLRQLATESVLLSCTGGVAGILVAAWGTRATLQVLPSALPAMSDAGIDLTVLAFASVVSVATGVLVALVPAYRVTRQNPQAGLSYSRGDHAVHHRAQRTMVVAQVALTLVLLLGAGLMMRSLAGLWNVNPGFDPDDVLMFYTGLSSAHVASPQRARDAFREINQRLERIPGIEAASITVGALPLTGTTTLGFWREDEPKPTREADQRTTVFSAVGPGYFQTMRIPLLRGRGLLPQDGPQQPRVVVVDEVFAREVFPGQDPLGKRIQFTAFDGSAEIVGIVGHVKHSGLDTDATAAFRAQLYQPYMQLPDNITRLVANTVGVVVRSSATRQALIGAIRKEIGSFDANQAMHSERLMTDVVASSLASRRFSLAVLGAFAAIALILSVVGVYSTVSYIVSQRTHEIGLRTALGGRPGDILWLVLSDGSKLAAVGVMLGGLLSLATTRLLAGLLFDVSATDAATFAAATVILFGAAVAACYLPARRAARVDPMVALRAE